MRKVLLGVVCAIVGFGSLARAEVRKPTTQYVYCWLDDDGIVWCDDMQDGSW